MFKIQEVKLMGIETKHGLIARATKLRNMIKDIDIRLGKLKIEITRLGKWKLDIKRQLVKLEFSYKR
jgi:hypothetical protein